MREAAGIEELARSVTVPDVNAFISKQLRVGLAGDEPEKLLEHPPEEDAFGRQQR